MRKSESRRARNGRNQNEKSRRYEAPKLTAFGSAKDLTLSGICAGCDGAFMMGFS